MKKNFSISCKKYTMAICLAILFCPFVFSQQIPQDKPCFKFLTGEFVQDGRDYTCFVMPGGKCSFHITFYGQSIYRIIVCSDNPEAKIEYRLLDRNKNLLFDNGQHDYTSFWDFEFKHTIDCTIEIKHVDPSTQEGFLYLVLAFKKEKQ